MPTDIIMPQMGESIVEGTITKWLKKPGDKVQRDEPLFEISTDKVDAEIPAPASGVLREIKVSEGTTVGVNTVVGTIATDGEAAAPAKPAPAAAPKRKKKRRKKRSRRREKRPLLPRAPTPTAAAPASARLYAGRRSPLLSARAQNRPRARHQSFSNFRHRARRTHHQAGHHGLHRARRSVRARACSPAALRQRQPSLQPQLRPAPPLPPPIPATSSP